MNANDIAQWFTEPEKVMETLNGATILEVWRDLNTWRIVFTMGETRCVWSGFRYPDGRKDEWPMKMNLAGAVIERPNIAPFVPPEQPTTEPAPAQPTTETLAGAVIERPNIAPFVPPEQPTTEPAPAQPTTETLAGAVIERPNIAPFVPPEQPTTEPAPAQPTTETAPK